MMIVCLKEKVLAIKKTFQSGSSRTRKEAEEEEVDVPLSPNLLQLIRQNV